MKPIFQLVSVLLFTGISQIGYSQEMTYEVENCEKINTEYNEIHATPYIDGIIVYTSTQRKDPSLICKDNEIDDQYADLYYAEKTGDFYQGNTLLHDLINQKYHNAVPTFSPDGMTMIFTRTDPAKNLKVLKLYSAIKEDGKWKEVKELPFNSNDFSNLHPTFSPDGNQMIFASTRDEKAGAPDLYIVDYQDFKWGEPRLLTGAINSKGVDYFPHWTSDNKLYFASDGHKGSGGLDVFVSTQKSDGTWSAPQALPRPINSKYDDFAFVPIESNEGFLASNRKGGRGQDDLYYWSSKITGSPINLSVIHEETKEGIGEAAISIVPSSPNPEALGDFEPSLLEEKELFSKKRKPVEYLVLMGATYDVTIEKEGFLPYTTSMTGLELVTKGELIAELTPAPKYLTVNGLAINKRDDTPLPKTEIEVLNKCTGETEVLTTNESGQFKLEIDCACDYELIGTKDNFNADELKLSTTTFNCDNPEILEAILRLEPAIKKGTVITLENIYYEFDKWDILDAAAIELNKVVRLMQDYPSMEIELSSHTDSRGNDDYNLQLSQKRAESAVAYIVSQGIDNQRIIAKGYGETNLVNNCSNGVDCEEEEHQLNRRTVVSITELAEGDVRIEYRN